MKKTLPIFVLHAFLFLNIQAQDNDVYTPSPNYSVITPAENRLNAVMALAGTYSIGGVSPDYATFSAAAADLSMQGVSGPVEFIIAPGTYVEQVVLNPVAGVSSVNTVHFRSLNNDSSSVTLAFPSSGTSANNFTLGINGADFVTFSGITFSRSGNGNYSTIVEINNLSDNITFTHNRFMGATGITTTNTDGSRSCIFSPDLNSNNNLVIDNNNFVDNANGIWVYGNPSQFATGAVVSNNVFQNFYVGVFLLNQDSPIVTGNIINRNSTTSTIDYYGISIRFCSGSPIVSKNKLTCHTGSYGIRLRSCNGTTVSGGLVVNNFVQLGDASTGNGISIEEDCTYQGIFNNNVHYNGVGSTGRALYVNGSGTSDIQLNNNIFANTGGGFSMYVTGSAVNGISGSDYNCIYSNGSSLTFWNGNINNLASHQALSGKDANSISVNPLYVSINDLHVTAPLLNNAGTPLAAVTDDIDGDLRNPVTPDIGADEFSPVGMEDMNPDNGISVFPNPASDFITIQLPGRTSFPVSVTVNDVNGKKVLQEKPMPSADNSIFVNTCRLANGFYFIILNDGAYDQVTRFVKTDQR